MSTAATSKSKSKNTPKPAFTPAGMTVSKAWQRGDGEMLYSFTSAPQATAKAAAAATPANRRKNALTALKTTGAPAWPLVQQAARVTIRPTERKPSKWSSAAPGNRLAMFCADPQIGFRMDDLGNIDPFHDEAAMALFVTAVRIEQPDVIAILCDYLDLPGQGKFAQEARFAQTAQHTFNRGYSWLAELRAAAPRAEIILIEGNHDRRLQNFVEANALSAFGLRRADLPGEEMPKGWPVMSLPHLLRLDSLDIAYIDAYPAATHWLNDDTRAIHGTKANSSGSTMAAYLNDLPFLNTWAGHTHRQEIVWKTTTGRHGATLRYAANPGALCRTDGAVPSVNGAIGIDGKPAKVWEAWQQGFGLLRFNETQSFPELVPIVNGQAVMNGQLLSAVELLAA